MKCPAVEVFYHLANSRARTGIRWQRWLTRAQGCDSQGGAGICVDTIKSAVRPVKTNKFFKGLHKRNKICAMGGQQG